MYHRFAARLISACALSLAFLWSAEAGAQGATPACATCHQNNHETIKNTAHGARNDASGSMCQACHGDTSEHVASSGAKKPANNLMSKAGSADGKTAVCMNCHAGNRQLAFWESGKHAKNEVACSTCHSIHGRNRGPVPAPYTNTSQAQVPNDPGGGLQADLCGTCHRQVRNDTLKPSHHPIPEGKVKCSDCHNPHGALTHAMVKQESVNEQCFSCHTDKRGPFVFGHPPVEENCLNCHTPHGSPHNKLLREKVPNVCQDCHTQGRHPNSYYDQNRAWINASGQPNANPARQFISRGCLNCHNQVHGSNAPSNRGRYWIR